MHRYGNVTIAVSSASALCVAGATTVSNVTVRGAYGNLPPLGAINSLAASDGRTGPARVNFTITDNHGTKENAECNNHGVCDTATGACRCAQLVVPGTTNFRFRFGSSDGYGGRGGRGDCGFAVVAPLECPSGAFGNSILKSVCSGRGLCDNTTFTCQCFEGFSGPSCNERTCPLGNAWFDEASSTNTAHAPLVCSGRGSCDAESGTCVCDANFQGAACDKLRCASTGGVAALDDCSGHGRCLPMWRLAKEAQTQEGEPGGWAYGDDDPGINPPWLWDRDMVFGCHCDSRNDMQPYNGPVSFVSGTFNDNPKAGGWTGYDCSRKWCPTGDDPLGPAGAYEVQTIGCSNRTGATGSGNFTLTFRGVASLAISPYASQQEIEEVLDSLQSIGDVGVVFPDVADGTNATACHPSYTTVNGTLNGVQQTTLFPAAWVCRLLHALREPCVPILHFVFFTVVYDPQRYQGDVLHRAGGPAEHHRQVQRRDAHPSGGGRQGHQGERRVFEPRSVRLRHRPVRVLPRLRGLRGQPVVRPAP